MLSRKHSTRLEALQLPGLFGIITERPSRDVKTEIKEMLTSVTHEPFYSTGSFSLESQGLYIGWTVHQGSFSDCMPIIDSKNKRVLFFSGQNFPDEDFLSDLRSKGYKGNFANASYLLEAYEAPREKFFPALNGWFCGVLVDTRRGTVHLFNDRYGIGRVYIYEAPDGFYFASEAKALLKVRKELRQIDPKGLGEFFVCDCVLENRTLFRNVSLLPGGSLWTFENGKLTQKRSYFTADEWENQEPFSSWDAFFEALDSTFARILPKYSRFYHPTAISLTGGLDTRMILAYLDAGPGEFPCYTFGGNSKETYDIKIARRVASVCHQPHTIVKLDSKFLANFPYYAEKTVYISDGCHDVCGAHDLYLNALAREVSPVRLTGKFGSEILRGTRMLWAKPPLEDLFDPGFRSYVTDAASTLAAINDSNEVSFAAFADIPWYEYGRLAIEQSQLNFVTPYMDNELVRLMFRGRHLVEKRDDIPIRGIRKRRPGLLKVPTDRGYPGNGFFPWITRQFYDKFLFKGDWFFNYMPPGYARVGTLLEKLNIQNLFLGRHFFTNYRTWFQHNLRDYISDFLLSPSSKIFEYINGSTLEKIIESHFRGQGCYLREINKALTVELIHRHLLDVDRIGRRS